jgi:hypothetical protein
LDNYIVADVAPWKAAIEGAARCQFEPQGWLTGYTEAVVQRAQSEAVAMVEVRYFPSGRMPRALLGGIYRASDTAGVDLAIGHTGRFAPNGLTCEGLLGEETLVGLPIEFAEAALHGFVQNDAQLPLAGSKWCAAAITLTHRSRCSTTLVSYYDWPSRRAFAENDAPNLILSRY